MPSLNNAVYVNSISQALVTSARTPEISREGEISWEGEISVILQTALKKQFVE